jgi:hypothetical protein
MADHVESHDPDLPPPSEVIHLPEPSYLPVTLALGVTIALLGIVTNVVISAIGVIIALVTLVRWVGQTRREMAELPLDH